MGLASSSQRLWRSLRAYSRLSHSMTMIDMICRKSIRRINKLENKTCSWSCIILTARNISYRPLIAAAVSNLHIYSRCLEQPPFASVKRAASTAKPFQLARAPYQSIQNCYCRHSSLQQQENKYVCWPLGHHKPSVHILHHIQLRQHLQPAVNRHRYPVDSCPAKWRNSLANMRPTSCSRST